MAASVAIITHHSSSVLRFQASGDCSDDCRLKCLKPNFLKCEDVISPLGAFHSKLKLYHGVRHRRRVMPPSVLVLAQLVDASQPEDNDDGDEEASSSDSKPSEVNAELFRKQMERILDNEDASFGGKDLATLIRKKYGRSYDVQMIKKEFMGRQLLAMNIMWKYREQRSFPLTEEEYLSHLDSVANLLRGWGAVSYVRTSLANTKERPRIGKAVSILIDLDETGGRAREWIYR